MSDVLFFVSCIEIIVCMFAVMRFHILMFLVKVFSDFFITILLDLGSQDIVKCFNLYI